MKNPGEFVLTLLNARTAAHVAHLQVTGPGSFAAHKALNEFYDGIVGLADRFAEAYQGCYGLIKFNGSSFRLEKDTIKMLESLKGVIAAARNECDESMLQQICDDMAELVASTLYKLKHLK
jgi:DNA-binding ferritin-like protein